MDLTLKLILGIMILLIMCKYNVLENFHEYFSEDNKALKLGPPYNDYPNAYFDYVNPQDFIKTHDYKNEQPTEFYHHPYGWYYPYRNLVWV